MLALPRPGTLLTVIVTLALYHMVVTVLWSDFNRHSYSAPLSRSLPRDRYHAALTQWPEFHCFNILNAVTTGLMIDATVYQDAMHRANVSCLINPSTAVNPSFVNLYLEHIDLPNVARTCEQSDKTNLVFDRRSSGSFRANQGSQTWLMVNPEFLDDRVLLSHDLPRVHTLIVKTEVARDQFVRFREKMHMAYRVLYLGHTSRDRMDSSIKKDWNSFVLLAGGSWVRKNAALVVATWRKHPEWPRLVLRAHREPEVSPVNVANIDWVKGNDLAADEVKRLQNAHGIHLCLSQTEGFGHYINEARSVGALVVTVNVPPMNELVNDSLGVLIGGRMRNDTEGFRCPSSFLNEAELEEGIHKVLSLSLAERQRRGDAARRAFLENDRLFKHKFGLMSRAACAPEERGLAEFSW